ncbi:MAG: flagellar brake protein, partial [Lachnospiraceae bacterium]|nr:flagellar brake protein [Lachnospiraceae bacterium]
MQEVISIGNKIDMEILIDGEIESDVRRRRVLYSRLMDIPEDNILRISMPFHEKRLVPLSMGEQYLLY